MKLFLFIIISWLTIGCSVINTSKRRFADSEYKNEKNQRVYVSENKDTLKLYHLIAKKDTMPALYRTYPATISNTPPISAIYHKSGLSVEVATIPLKFRPSQGTTPAQLNANLNIAGFVGYRKDFFKVHYIQNRKSGYSRIISNYGFAAGGFLGVSGSPIKPSLTNNAINFEYDGVTLNKGFALVGSVNKVSVGLAIGFDNLLDKNRKYWIYQNKPWLGLLLGYKLN